MPKCFSYKLSSLTMARVVCRAAWSGDMQANTGEQDYSKTATGCILGMES